MMTPSAGGIVTRAQNQMQKAGDALESAVRSAHRPSFSDLWAWASILAFVVFVGAHVYLWASLGWRVE